MGARHDCTIRPRVDGVALVVRSMAATLGFYRLLGLEVPAQADDEDYVIIEAGPSCRLSWSRGTRVAASRPTRCVVAGHDRVSLVLRCASPAHVDALFARVVAAGHPTVLEPFDAPWGARHCRLRDPDGTDVDVFAPLP